MIRLVDRWFLKQPLLRRYLTSAITGNREEKVILLAREIIVHTTREHGYFRASRLARTCSLFRDELPVLIHLAGLLGNADTFLDIGANAGIFSVHIASFRTIYPNFQVYAFEPNPDTAERLRRNAEPLGVRVFPFALSDHNGSIEFVDGAVSNVFTTVQNASAWSIPRERVVCPCRRLDDLPIAGKSIIMKIDIEGQELEMLLGAKNNFESGRIRALYLDDYKDRRIRDFLDRYGFRYFNGRTLEAATEETRHLLALKPREG